MRRHILILAAALMLAGCAYGPLNALPGAGPDAAELVIIRAGAFLGAGLPYDVAVDSVDVFALKPGGYAILKVAPGPHTIVARFPKNFPKDPRRYTLSINAAPNERLYFTVELDSLWGNDIKTTQIDAGQGEALMKKSAYQPG